MTVIYPTGNHVKHEISPPSAPPPPPPEKKPRKKQYK